MNPTIDWQALKNLTEYCREDIKGFCEDEGFPVYPGRLHPFQALFLRNLLLCNWSVREGYFAYYWQAQQAFELFWAELPDDISDCQLTKSWMAWCEAGKRATCGDQDTPSAGLLFTIESEFTTTNEKIV